MRSWIRNKETEKDVSYIEYKVLDTKVMVGSRPDCAGISKEFGDSVGAWLNVDDRFIDYPPNYKVQWSFWNEDYEATYSVLYTSLITLHRWIIDERLNSVYIHCAAGTHRAPTIFGAFLHTYFPLEKEGIVEKHTKVRRENLSNPVEYFNIHLEKNPTDIKFVEMMREFPFSEDRNFRFIDEQMKKYGIKDIPKVNELFKSYYE